MRKRNSIQCPKIDENQCRINTIHLTVGDCGGGGGGVRTISMRRLHWKRKETFLNIFANGVFRCHLDSGVSQLLLCYQQPFLLRGGGCLHISKAHFFCRNFGQIFFIHQWPLSLTVKGGIKISPHIQEGWWMMPNSAKLVSRIKAPM